MEESWSAFKMLTGKPTEKRLLGRPPRRWVDTLKMYVKKNGINNKNCVDWDQFRNYLRGPLNAALNFCVS